MFDFVFGTYFFLTKTHFWWFLTHGCLICSSPCWFVFSFVLLSFYSCVVLTGKDTPKPKMTWITHSGGHTPFFTFSQLCVWNLIFTHKIDFFGQIQTPLPNIHLPQPPLPFLLVVWCSTNRIRPPTKKVQFTKSLLDRNMFTTTKPLIFTTQSQFLKIFEILGKNDTFWVILCHFF